MDQRNVIEAILQQGRRQSDRPTRVQVGLDMETGKVALVFDCDLREIRIDPAKARDIGLALIKGADAVDAMKGPSRGVQG